MARKKKAGVLTTIIAVVWGIAWFIVDQTLAKDSKNTTSQVSQTSSKQQASKTSSTKEQESSSSQVEQSGEIYLNTRGHEDDNPCMVQTKGRTSKKSYADSPVQICRLEHLPLTENAKVSASSIINYNLATCKVSAVHDGDTVHCRLTSNPKNDIKIRLLGIDAPETKQIYGKQSTEFLRKLILGKDIALYTTGLDVYKRYLGTLYLQEGSEFLNVNQYMVATGNAWVYNYSNKSSQMYKVYTQVSKTAQQQQLGLWNPQYYKNGKGPQEPKVWRERK
ncbi:thermonuclease family protein [Psittacicella gerlachiana]|uniref:TNase-like domain-containing protein n=1 Tax=Psittacicella gerlachiana TaxID=2028574 RepID=A0A3A1YJW1_9GAMM|nr:thermonuclease family protein [Psittacicella gerlachiana]RIY38563.1 hypothetical protein CKF59_00555 [Psittacicella gerlachiana]